MRAHALAHDLQIPSVMPSMLVTCPESAHLEEIEYQLDPLGMLIDRCTAFAGCSVTCPRTCAARLDRRHAKRLVGTTLLARSCLRRFGDKVPP